MNCTSAQTLLPELLDKTLPDDQAVALRSHLESCPTCREALEQLSHTLATLDQLPAEEPSPALRRRFNAMLSEELAREQRRSSPLRRLASFLEDSWAAMAPRPALQFAYSLALMLAGIFIGMRFLATPAPAPLPADGTQRELAELRSKIDSMGQLVAYSIVRQESDNARLRQVAALMDNNKIDRHQLAQLVNTLAFDPSTNVRLSALEGLYAHADKPIVREGVLASLPRERSPLVQIAMIDFLTSLKEAQALPAFEAIARDASADKAVREAARYAIAQL